MTQCKESGKREGDVFVRTSIALTFVVVAFLIAVAIAFGHTKVIVGTNGNDIEPNFCILQGHQHKDRIFGLDGIDELCGLQDADTLYAGHGSDTMYGGKGPDMLFGSYGNDNLWGMRGNDKLNDIYGNNVFDCGRGIDTVTTNFISLGNIARNCEHIISSRKESYETDW